MQAITTSCLSSLPTPTRHASDSPDFFWDCFQAVGVFFPIFKLQWIGGQNIIRNFLELAVIKQKRKVLFAPNPEMITAQRIYPEIFFKFAPVNGFTR
jgi:hypothetical protein